ncbi:Fumarase [Rubrobacter radiotolerans]|uniref:Fumarate hydratase class II n=1 Tax=Rubrobacter radiotolerans TaxID=42256 RepID=A0A023X5W7_RUBRA|nr:class II fumarate hydratase [Rubrobacter radiotolerans]AHY47566.1 Fumarase [Rubrobacter radiotolerans]MDX5894971.1 class II fumarate hydratase [Rubrobacter radiotolerans]SMC07166.1 fumarase, class II [Rubrobacter radiotolerans DSM 5868]
MTESPKNTRTERDSMGPVEVPEDALYGAQTGRALENFPISDLRFNRRFIQALAAIKLEAAEVNFELGVIDERLRDVIVRAAEEVVRGEHDRHFVLDIFQTGSGTSTNMNANEVISNRAIQLAGGEVGSKDPVHPNDHVNQGQSSNDVIPTAIHLSTLIGIKEDLLPALEKMQAALESKASEFDGVVKTGRTHLQDATPIRLGQEFRGYAGQVERGIARVRKATEDLAEVALGGTAVGTGVNARPGFAEKVCARLAERFGVEVRETENHFQAQSALDATVFASGALKTVAVSFLKIANDIRFLGSGPRAGYAEIALPEVQPGSSIMPGKVNPVIAESAAMVSAQVLGNDATVAYAGSSGNFELNVMMPVIAYNLNQSVDLLAATANNLTDQCIAGLEATDRGPALVEQGLMLATALAPEIGYDTAAALAKEAYKTDRTIREVAREKTDLTEEQLDDLLDASKMTGA